jgi:Putative Actinobacterial Holin-X, holin superfamily III
LALARAQFTEALSSAKAGVVSLAAAGAILFAGFLVLLAAAVLALAQVLPSWAAALIIGFMMGAIGYGLLQAARKKLDPSVFKPTKTQQSLERDKRVLERKHP